MPIQPNQQVILHHNNNLRRQLRTRRYSFRPSGEHLMPRWTFIDAMEEDHFGLRSRLVAHSGSGSPVSCLSFNRE